MSGKRFFKRLFGRQSVVPDYAGVPRERLEDLWATREQLTDEAREALEVYREALDRMPRLAPVHFNRGNALVRQGRLIDAIDAYRTCTSIWPEWVDPRVNLASVLWAAGRRKEAWREVKTLKKLGVSEELLARLREQMR